MEAVGLANGAVEMVKPVAMVSLGRSLRSGGFNSNSRWLMGGSFSLRSKWVSDSNVCSSTYLVLGVLSDVAVVVMTKVYSASSHS